MDELQMYSKFKCFLRKKHFRSNGSFLRAFILCLSFNHFRLDFFLTNPKSMPTSFCFFPLCLHEKSVMFLYWTRLVDTRSINVVSKRKKRWPIPWKSRIFHPRILELVRLCESSIWSVKIADRVGREILLV